MAAMDLGYVPAGRWVRVRTRSGAAIELHGRWHLATADPRFPAGTLAGKAVVACGRSLAAARPGADFAVALDLPSAHVCSICSDRYVRDRLFEMRVHNLTTASPA